MKHFLLTASLFGFLFLNSTTFAVPVPDAEGTYACDPVEKNQTSGFIPICHYKVKDPGNDERFESLLNRINSRALVMFNELGYNRRTLLPHRSEPNVISWWTDDEITNNKIGTALIEADQPFDTRSPDTVQLEVTLYQHSEGAERKLGVELGGFLGHRKAEDFENGREPGHIEGVLGKVLTFVFGNALTSSIELGLEAAHNNGITNRSESVTFSGRIGQHRKLERLKLKVFSGSTEVIQRNLGFHISATPRYNSKNPNQIELRDLQMWFSQNVDEENFLDDRLNIFNGEDITLEDGKLYLLAGTDVTLDSNKTKILKTDREMKHDHYYVKMRLHLNQSSKPKIDLNHSLEVARKDYSKTGQIADTETLLPFSTRELVFEEVLKSLKLVCFKNPINTATTEKICGFQFTEMDPYFANKMVKFSVMPTRYQNNTISPGTIDAAFSPETYMRAGRVYGNGSLDESKYTGNDFYRLPLLRGTPTSEGREGAAEFTLRVELDAKNDLDRALLARLKVPCIYMHFGYYPGEEIPIQGPFDPKTGNLVRYNYCEK